MKIKPAPKPLPLPLALKPIPKTTETELQEVRDAAIRRAKVEFDRLKAPILSSPQKVASQAPQIVPVGLQPMTAEEFAAHSEREYFRGRKVMGLPADFSMCPAEYWDTAKALAKADLEKRRAEKLGLPEKNPQPKPKMRVRVGK